jgi:sulfite exporter TauE/SafE
LGLSSGAVCLAYCAPVLVPYILGEGQPIRQNSMILARFLSGRLFGYLLVGLLTGLFNFLIVDKSPSRSLLFGSTYMVLAILLGIYGFFDIRRMCIAE